MGSANIFIEIFAILDLNTAHFSNIIANNLSHDHNPLKQVCIPVI